MPIINKGIFEGNEVFQRQVGNDWPTAQVITTSDVIEATNLYFTNARVASNITTLMQSFQGDNIVIEANGRISANITFASFSEVSNISIEANFANVAETANIANTVISLSNFDTDDLVEGSNNLYYTNTRVDAYINDSIDTDDISEGANNLYFTNTRAILSVFPATTQLVVSTPVFNYNIDQYSGDNPEIYVTAGETISFELLNSSSHPFNIRVSNGGSEYNTGLTHVDTDGTISTGSAAQGKYTGKLFWKIPYDLAGNTYVYQCTNHSSMVGNIVIQGSVLSTITNKDLTLNNLTVNGDLTVKGNTTTLNTATLVIEDKNIVIANGAADAATADGAGITIDGAGANITYRESGDKLEINKNISILGDLDVTGNISGNGITIRGIEVSDAVLSGNITAEGGISGNTIVVDSITANTWNNLYTSNVIETSGNLYFTVPRARSAFTAGENIVIDDGEISALVPIAVTNENQVFVTQANVLTYNLNRVISDPNNILVTIEGLLQLPSTDYTVADDSITFTSGIPVGANVEIRYFGLETINTRVTLVAVTDTFVGDGANVEFQLSVSPPNKDYVLAIIDGVTQQSAAFSISGFNIVFTEPPAANSNIDVRVFGGKVGGAYNTRTYVGDGSTTEFVISSNFDENSVLIFENGIAQVPTSDYTVNNGTLIFVEAPAPNVVVQVRELGGTADTVISKGVATTSKSIAMSIVFGG